MKTKNFQQQKSTNEDLNSSYEPFQSLSQSFVAVYCCYFVSSNEDITTKS